MHPNNPAPNQPQPMPAPSLSKEEILKNSTDVKCECGNNTFHDVIMLKRVSAIISPTGKVTLFPIEGLACDLCNRLLEIKN